MVSEFLRTSNTANYRRLKYEQNRIYTDLQNNNINSNVARFNDSVHDDIFCVVKNYNNVDIFLGKSGG